jgi:hypothetical protein
MATAQAASSPSNCRVAVHVTKPRSLRQWTEAGVSWFVSWFPTGPGPFDLVYAEVREHVSGGPPRRSRSSDRSV